MALTHIHTHHTVFTIPASFPLIVSSISSKQNH